MCDFDGFRRAVEGAQCLGLLAQEYRRDGDLVSPANVLFLQVAPGRWLRFFLDAGVFFWREVPAVLLMISKPVPRMTFMGRPKLTRLKRLKNSARNCRTAASVFPR